jgi:hypothetical protein
MGNAAFPFLDGNLWKREITNRNSAGCGCPLAKQMKHQVWALKAFPATPTLEALPRIVYFFLAFILRA